MSNQLNRTIIEIGEGRGRKSPKALPERVLQFGTGGFLRGFADSFIQEAVEQGRFDGSVVVVGSTGSGRVDDLNAQDGLYTLLVRGRESGKTVDDARIVSVISRAVAASDRWDEVLAAARSAELSMIVSNTTEVGIVLDENDRIDSDPPKSFPGKLTAVLFERARAFDFDLQKGVVVLPCELIESNGDRLERIVIALASLWSLGDQFISWIKEANRFCNTLVDRIVPGTPRGADARDLEQRLGYRDALLTVAEPYRLWAIEGDEAFSARFPLTGVDPGIVVTTDIVPFRERKVRILNGIHTVMVPAAILARFDTVHDVMEDPVFKKFIKRIALQEIVPTLSSDPEAAREFAGEVFERFENPFIRHELIDITFQQTRKLSVRVLPSLTGYVDRFGKLPESIVLGLAAFILFNHPGRRPEGVRAPEDDARGIWEEAWNGRSPSRADEVTTVVQAFVRNESVWGQRLDRLSGLVGALTRHIVTIERRGMRAATEAHLQDIEVELGVGHE